MEIRELVDSGVIAGADVGSIGPLSYDLSTREFYTDDEALASVSLAPGESVFVGSEETIDLPSNLACRVMLRNSRIRQGLHLDAPLYFPGHKTRVFFRMTNVSANTIALDREKGPSSIAFEEVQGVTHPYEGAFSEEFDFRGMGDYRDIYRDDVKIVEN